MKLKKEQNKRLVFVIEEHGRTPTMKYMHNLLSELFGKASGEGDVDATVACGAAVNTCEYLLDQIAGREIPEWDVIYLPDGGPPALLGRKGKGRLTTLLSKSGGTSAEAVRTALAEQGSDRKD